MPRQHDVVAAFFMNRNVRCLRTVDLRNSRRNLRKNHGMCAKKTSKLLFANNNFGAFPVHLLSFPGYRGRLYGFQAVGNLSSKLSELSTNSWGRYIKKGRHHDDLFPLNLYLNLIL